MPHNENCSLGRQLSFKPQMVTEPALCLTLRHSLLLVFCLAFELIHYHVCPIEMPP